MSIISKKEEQNEEQLLYVAERLLPAHTGTWKILNDDELLGPLKGHLLSEHGRGIKAINDEMLHEKKAAVDAATTTIES